LNLHGVVKKLLLPDKWIFHFLFSKLAFKTSFVEEAYTIEDGADYQGEEDLLADLSSTLHRIPLDSKSISLNQLKHLSAETSLSLFLITKIRSLKL